MESYEIQEVLRKKAGGRSLRATAKDLGISKSTVKRCLDRINQVGLTVQEAIVLKPASLASLLEIKTNVRTGFFEPDFETAYCLNNIHGKNHRSLRQLWQEYRDSAPKGSRALGYKGFWKAYKRFCQNLPESCLQVQMTHQWTFGEVAMIDYSGDGLAVTEGDKNIKAQIFVGVLAASGYIFCYATAHQTRDDWLDAQIKMFEFFGGVPREIYLDNSTSLVSKPDKYQPKVCAQYQEFCNYYGTRPVPVRPGQPKDKAAVENTVKLVQLKVMNPLRNRAFFSFEELNKALSKELDKLNRRPLTTRSDGVSRYDLAQEERIVLLPLPTVPYEISSVTKILKVQKNSLIRFENIRYSVPFGFLGRKVKVIKSTKTGIISIFDLQSGERICTYYPPTGKPQDVILPQHMPERIRIVMQSKDELASIISQAGPASKSMCEVLMTQGRGEIVRKALRGINSLRTSIGDEAFEACCKATLQRSNPSYAALREEAQSLIGNKGKKLPRKTLRRAGTVNSEDVRGSGFYERLLEQRTGEVL